MGRDLIKRYSIDKLSGRNLFAFIRDVYGSGKSREFVSFAIWEALYKLGLFPKRGFIKFNDGDMLVLGKEGLHDPELSNRVGQVFKKWNLNVASAEHEWKRFFVDQNEYIYGYLDTDDRRLYRSTDNGKSLTLIYEFPERIKSLFVSSQNAIIVSVKGAVYAGRQAGDAFEFKRAIELGSSESFFRHNYAITEAPDKTLIIAEYGNVWENHNWRQLANLYFSSDNGQTWKKSDFFIKKGTNKHIHIIHYSPLLKRLLLADGDNYKKLWISSPSDSFCLEDIRWKPITKFHIQTGGYTSVVENDGKVFFGTDYQGGTNFIVESTDGRKFQKRIIPDPYRRSPIHSLVLRKTNKGNEIWANLPISNNRTRSLLMYTRDNGETWNKVIEYNSKLHTVSLIGASHHAMQDLYCSIKDVKSKDRIVYKITDLEEINHTESK